MKQQILNLKKKLLIVELETFDPVKMIHEKNVSYFGQKMQLIGKLTDITEEQFKEWVESTVCYIGSSEHTECYYNYHKGSPFSTAKESFFSYLESQGFYFSNPLGKKPDGTPILFSQRNGALELLEWQEAEEKVWSKDNCYIFEII